MLIFTKGLTIGFLMAAIVGPIGLLCIRRSFSHGFVVGIASGLGAACADGIYASIAAFSFSSLSKFLLQHSKILSIAGAVYLVYLGVKLILTVPSVKQEEPVKFLGLLHSILTTFILTMTNPVTIVTFIAIFSSFGILTQHLTFSAASMLTGGVFTGSMFWWILIAIISHYLRAHLTQVVMLWINRVSGAALILFAVLAVAR